jgi:hypothetical protein
MFCFRVRKSDSGYLVDRIGAKLESLNTYLVRGSGNNQICSCENFGSHQFPHNHTHILLVRKFIELGEPDFVSFYLDENKKIKWVKA